MEYIAAIIVVTALVAYLLGRNTARTEMLSRNAALEAEHLRQSRELEASRESINNLSRQLTEYQKANIEFAEEFDKELIENQKVGNENSELKENLFCAYLQCARLNSIIANCYESPRV